MKLHVYGWVAGTPGRGCELGCSGEPSGVLSTGHPGRSCPPAGQVSRPALQLMSLEIQAKIFADNKSFFIPDDSRSNCWPLLICYVYWFSLLSGKDKEAALEELEKRSQEEGYQLNSGS